jgi:hypothetical protein
VPHPLNRGHSLRQFLLPNSSTAARTIQARGSRKSPPALAHKAGLHVKRTASGSHWPQFSKSRFVHLRLGHFSPLTCAVRNKPFNQPPVQARRKSTKLSFYSESSAPAHLFRDAHHTLSRRISSLRMQMKTGASGTGPMHPSENHVFRL